MEDTTRRVSRRSLIAGAAAGAAAGALPAASARAAGSGVRRTEVAIVGAGLAGLSAAHQLTRRGKSVLVVEARDRVGGRTLNHSIGGGHVIEIGGQWIGPTQDRLAALAKQVGVKTFKTYNQGENISWIDGAATRYPATAAVPALPDDATQALVNAVVTLDGLAKNVPLDAPWNAPDAPALDGQTFETWKLANAPTPRGRAVLDVVVEAVWAAEPSDVSLLHVLFYIASAGDSKNPGSLARLISTAGGAQESRFVGGSQRVSLELAKRLGARRLMLGAPVRRIFHSGKGVRLVTDCGTVQAKHVIVAVPPTLARSHRLRARPARSARPAHAARPAGLRDQVPGDLLRAVLAQERPERPGGERPGADQDHVRQLAAGRLARRDARASSRATTPACSAPHRRPRVARP